MQLTVAIYQLTKRFPREELYGLTNQIRRTVVSLPSNIAEGRGRFDTGEYPQFLAVARASSLEVQTQLQAVREPEMGSRQLIDQAESLSCEVGRTIYAILESIKD